MTIGSFLELGVLALGSVIVMAMLLSVAKNVRGGHKGKYRTSWFEEH